MKAVTDGDVLWTPTKEQIEQSSVKKYMNWLEANKGLRFESHAELWKWSVEKLEQFWETVWEYGEIQSSKPYTCVLEERKMPRANWFPGARLN
ncbi:MAG: acetoacetate--CoA ligase, partial [Anoxybacillus ayderensis]|nr:acetoacetate--CoA ligase [Anoxybacillus ayderensis]